MEHLALGLVWLLGMLFSISPVENQVSIVEKALDMAPNSFDDQYQGCNDKMEAKLKELNHTEFETNEIYATAWKETSAGLQGHMSQSSVLKPEQAIALMTYKGETPTLEKKFNEDVHEAGRSRKQYLKYFHFKVLHFLMTSALRALRDAQPHECYKVYRVVKNVIFTAQPGETVRFGQFADSTLNTKSAEGFGDGTFFSVKTCYGVPIRNIIDNLLEEWVLIPPFEIFNVTSVTREGNRARIDLESQAVYSKYNCEYVKGHSVTLAPLWAFLLAATALATTVGI